METDREEDRGPELHLPRFIFDGPRSSSYVDFRVNLVDVKLEIDAIRAMEGKEEKEEEEERKRYVMNRKYTKSFLHGRVILYVGPCPSLILSPNYSEFIL